jgi:hypothetical protein
MDRFGNLSRAPGAISEAASAAGVDRTFRRRHLDRLGHLMAAGG